MKSAPRHANRGRRKFVSSHVTHDLRIWMISIARTCPIGSHWLQNWETGSFQVIYSTKNKSHLSSRKRTSKRTLPCALKWVSAPFGTHSQYAYIYPNKNLFLLKIARACGLVESNTLSVWLQLTIRQFSGWVGTNTRYKRPPSDRNTV